MSYRYHLTPISYIFISPALMKSECLGIGSKYLGNSVATANRLPGILNQSGSSLKIGWAGTSSNGGGVSLRIGIGKSGNKSWSHTDVGGTFVPNNVANPYIKFLHGK